MSSYKYGTYEVENKIIILDKKDIDNVIKTTRLEIKTIETDYKTGVKKEDYMFQVNKNGEILKNETVFRVIIDNRNK